MIDGSADGASHWPPALADSDVEILHHPGDPSSSRLDVRGAQIEQLTITIKVETHLDEAIGQAMRDQRWTAASGLFEEGSARSFSYSYPIPGPDQRCRVALSPPVSVEDPMIHRGGITVGTRDGLTFAHSHVVFTDSTDRLLGGHLHFDTVVLAPGSRIRLWGTQDVAISAEHDPEIGASIFEFHRPTPTTISETVNGAYARVHPNVDITAAVEEVVRRTGLEGFFLLPGQIGSLAGATFIDGGQLRRIDGPVVEVLSLVAVPAAQAGASRIALRAAIVDSKGVVHSGMLARDRNPVAMTFELAVTEAPTGGKPPLA